MITKPPDFSNSSEVQQDFACETASPILSNSSRRGLANADLATVTFHSLAGILKPPSAPAALSAAATTKMFYHVPILMRFY
jgi:hypothetical protein